MAALLVMTMGFFAAGQARAEDLNAFEFRRPMEGINAAGYYRVEVDPELYRYTRSIAPLADIRLLDAASQEVPYFIRPVRGTASAAEDRAVTLVDPVVLSGGASRAVLDLGQNGLKHNEVRLVLAGHNNFLRRVRLEISNDERHFELLDNHNVVFRAESPAGLSEQTTLRYPTSDARYLRVTLSRGEAGEKPIQMTGATVALAAQAEANPVRTVAAHLRPLRRGEQVKASRWEVDLGQPGLPVSALDFAVETPSFERRARVAFTNDSEPEDGKGLADPETFRRWVEEGGGWLYRAPGAENIPLEAGNARQRFALVTVEDGDDAPLSISAVKAEYRPEELVFRADAPGPYTLLVGQPKALAPHYDLEAVFARLSNVTPQPATLGSISRNPNYAAPVVASPSVPFTERHRTVLAAGLMMMLAILGGWTFVLLRRPVQASGQPEDREKPSM